MSRTTMTGDCTDKVNILKRGVKLHQLKAAMMSVCPAYTDFLRLKAAKVQDMKALLEHVDLPPSVTFYRNLKGDDGFEDDAEEFE